MKSSCRRFATVRVDMLDQRNLMSHTYDDESFRIAFDSISRRYLTAIEQVFTWLKQRARE
ncbi:MAG: nucleotidyltransferase substrate binding protein [Planctomycetes bacterium]|nr:nucleotidyltransferase substrate binding protein [Planctomycetota bacterium]